MKVADLSTTSLATTAARTGSGSLLWLFRFTNGHQDAAASARWNAGQGFTFGFNDYAVGSTPCESTGPTAPSEKCVIFPGDQPIQGLVDQTTGTIKLSVPAYLLRGLSGSQGNGQRPTEVPATVGTRFYDAEALSVGNASPVQDVQSFLYPLDNTPAMDFLLPASGTTGGGGGGGGGDTGCKVNGGGAIVGASSGEAKFTLNAHASGLKGQNAYIDKGAGVDFRSTQLTSVTCSAAGAGTIIGAGVNGKNAVTFTIRAVDNGEPGKTDTLTITLSDGYANGPKTLTKGNVQVHG
jgi:hypothetical protein